MSSSTDLVRLSIDEMVRVSKAFSDSQRFGRMQAQEAFVSILAGQELGIPPFASMTGIHVIQGKPVLGSGILASLVKASSKYDYRVVKHDASECVLAFFEGGDHVGDSAFSVEDAKKAGLVKPSSPWVTYPRNMVFARALSNGVSWYCPDVASGRLYVEGEIEEPAAVPAPPRDVVATVDVESVDVFPDDLPDVIAAKDAPAKASPTRTRDSQDAAAEAEASELFGEAFAENQAGAYSDTAAS